MVAVATSYMPLNAPYVVSQEIIDALKVTLPSKWNIPVYDEYPSETDKVRFGLYVTEVYTAERNINQLGIQYCGAYYNAIDTFNVIYVSFQQDPYELQVNEVIANLVTLKVGNTPLFDGYFARTFTQDLSYGPTRAAIHTWTFRLTRLEFNTPNT